MVAGVIASYPRSGSNWFADLLGFSIWSHYNSSDRNKVLPLDPRKPKSFFRTHGIVKARKRIFIVRHPMDVALSFVDFAKLAGFGKQCPDIFNFFLEIGRHPNLSDTWNEMCHAYDTEDTFWLSYEQLHRCPMPVLYQAIDYLGLRKPKSKSVIMDAIQKSSFAQMRADEDAGKIYDNAIRHRDREDAKFYNHGKPGRRFLCPIETQKAFDEAFKEGIDIAMKRIDAPFHCPF